MLISCPNSIISYRRHYADSYDSNLKLIDFQNLIRPTMIGKALAQQIIQTLVKLSTEALVKIFPGHNVITACSGTTTIVLV